MKVALINLRHTGELEEHITKFFDISNQLDMREKDLIAYFINGLKKKSHLIVDLNEPTTLAEAMKMARNSTKKKHLWQKMAHKVGEDNRMIEVTQKRE